MGVPRACFNQDWTMPAKTFSSCLLSTRETVDHNVVAAVTREHHLPDQRSLSAHHPFDHRPDGGESSRQCIPNHCKFRLFKYLACLGFCTSLTLASVVQRLRLCRRKRPVPFFFSFQQQQQQQPSRTFDTNRCVASRGTTV